MHSKMSVFLFPPSYNSISDTPSERVGDQRLALVLVHILTCYVFKEFSLTVRLNILNEQTGVLKMKVGLPSLYMLKFLKESQVNM